ncbi:hypothetical protein BH10ACT1_BH10ACT1_05640 [soil metagenome]
MLIFARSTRTAVALLALLIGAAVALGPAAPASAADPAPKVTADFTYSCGPQGAVVKSVIANLEGTAPADITFSVTGFADDHFTLVPGFTGYQTSWTTLADGRASTFAVTEAGGYSTSVTYDADQVDCFHYLGDVVLHCDGDQPYVDATATQTGEIPTDVYFTVGAHATDDEVVTGSHTFTTAVQEDEYYVVSLRTDQDSYFAELSGIADCKADPVTSTTVPPTTVAPPVTTAPHAIEPLAVGGTGTDVPPAPPAGAPITVAPTELARTGSNSGVLAGLGLGLLLLGVGALRISRRRPTHG